ncbi:hypothetical protein [Aureivirga marina]|uniref:hypothetical protein n=1 Tax=Aureivirga marina TaxID=1182451 RepID=UPI0018C90D99|nr:hypothetical protein [Aureivirga marina]
MKFDVKNIITGERLIVLHVFFTSNSTKYRFLVLDKKKENIEVVSDVLGGEEILNKIPKNYPIILHINGRGVLNKKFDDNATQAIFRNSDEIFLSTTYKEKFISFIRKSVILEWLEAHSSLEKRIIACHVGVFIFGIVLEHKIELFSNKKAFQYEITAENEEIISFNKSDFSDAENEKELLFSSGVQYFFPSKFLEFSSKDEWDLPFKNKEEFVGKKQIEQILKIGILVILLCILADKIAYNHYGTKHQILQSEMAFLQKKESQLKTLEQTIQRKKNMLKEAGFLNYNMLSFYYDQIIQLLPKTIKLTNIDVFPLEKKIKPSKKILIKGNEISVEGWASDEALFDIWVQKIRLLEWNKTVEIIQYSWNSKKQKAKFKINIKLQ